MNICVIKIKRDYVIRKYLKFRSVLFRSDCLDHFLGGPDEKRLMGSGARAGLSGPISRMARRRRQGGTFWTTFSVGQTKKD